jgi:hypothetical protein
MRKALLCSLFFFITMASFTKKLHATIYLDFTLNYNYMYNFNLYNEQSSQSSGNFGTENVIVALTQSGPAVPSDSSGNGINNYQSLTPYSVSGLYFDNNLTFISPITPYTALTSYADFYYYNNNNSNAGIDAIGDNFDIETIVSGDVPNTSGGDNISRMMLGIGNQNSIGMTQDTSEASLLNILIPLVGQTFDGFESVSNVSSDTYPNQYGNDFMPGSEQQIYEATATLDSVSTVPPTTATPEPCTMALMGIGAVGMGFMRRRAKRA